MQDYKKAEILVWEKSPWKEAFTDIYYLSRQTEEVFYPQFTDEKTKNHLRPLPRVLIIGQSLSFHSLTDSSLPPKEGSWIHYLSFKTVSRSKNIIFLPFSISRNQEKIVCVCACMCTNTHVCSRVCVKEVWLTNHCLFLNKWVSSFQYSHECSRPNNDGKLCWQVNINVSSICEQMIFWNHHPGSVTHISSGYIIWYDSHVGLFTFKFKTHIKYN